MKEDLNKGIFVLMSIMMSIIRRLLLTVPMVPFLAASVINAVEFEVLDRFSVDGYSQFIGSAAIRSDSFTVGGSSFAVQYGKVGIGTSTPSVLLHISTAAGVAGDLVVISTGESPVIRMTGAGDIYANKFHGDGDSLGDHTATQRLDMSGNPVLGVSSLTVITPDTYASSLWVSTSAATPHLYVSTAGKVGIGTTGPVANLDVSGEIKVGYAASTCTSAMAGTLRWYDGHISVCNGANWRQLDNQPPPVITSITPVSGLFSGGTAITIAGTGFSSDLELSIGGAAAASIVVTGAAEITAITPAGTAGAREVKITNSDGQYVTGTFTYNPLPTITTVSPANGPQGTVITIAGTGFISGAGLAVEVGGVAATGVTWDSATQLRATTPGSTTSGAKDVKVTNPDTGAVTNSNGFTYLVLAEGGTIVGSYRVHTFTASGTFTVLTGGGFEVLVVAGGGGGGYEMGGGGGAGGFFTGTLSLASGNIPVTVGDGGAGRTSNLDNGGQGGDSVLGAKTVSGGGAGGNNSATYDGTATNGRPRAGGSGGGCGEGSGAPPVTGGEGNYGGDSYELGYHHSGGGGGAGAAGANATTNGGGNGGAGRQAFDGLYYAGGGGGGVYGSASGGSKTPGSGGTGGGGNAGAIGTVGNPGVNGKGGGGGGGSYSPSSSGGRGGSGIVIIRYLK